MKTLLVLFFLFSTNFYAICEAGEKHHNSTCDMSKSSFRKTIAALVENYENESNNAGSLLIKYGRKRFIKSEGIANLPENARNTFFTSFLIASVGKQFTATAIMKLVDQGLLSVETKVTDILNELDSNLWTVNGKTATIHHLLTNSAGTPDAFIDPYIGEKLYKEKITIDDVLDVIMDKEVNFEPGSQYEYSNTGYILLGEIVRRISNQSFASFTKDNLFRPYHLRRTTVGPLAPSRFVAQPYLLKDGEIVSYLEEFGIEERHDYDTFTDGNVYSNVIELARWIKLLVGGKVLSAESTTKMFTPHHANYGYGWEIRNNSDGSRTIQHTGDWIGYYSWVIHITDYDFTLVLLLNQFDNDPGPAIKLAIDIIAATVCQDSPNGSCDYL